MKALGFLILLLFGGSGVALAQNFTLEGHLTDVRNDTVLINYVKYEPDKEIIETKVPVDSDGRFSYVCQIQYAYEADFTVQSNKNKSSFFIVPDEQVVIEGTSDFSDGWTVKGSSFYQKWNGVRQMMLPFSIEFKEAEDRYEKGVAAGLSEAQMSDERKASNLDINRRLWKVSYQYIRQYPAEDVSATLLLCLDYKDILPAIGLLSPKVRAGRFKLYIDKLEEMFGRVMREIKASENAVQEIKEGETSPGLVLKDSNGNDFQLNTLFHQGKYIVVDFWGSWCTWCIKGFPKMKAYHHKYQDKLDIVSVACHDKESRWKAAVNKHQLPWYNVLSEDGTTEVRFGVKGYPYKVLISPEGKVIKSFVGETEAFYQLLDQLLAHD